MRQALSKRQLTAALARTLKASGYRSVPGPLPSGASALFFKPTDELVLTLGLETSTLYEQRFAGSFYLSRSFTWSLLFRDFPREAYSRVGTFLTQRERERLLSAEFRAPGVKDAWWVGFTDEAARCFAEAVTLCEPRFLAQRNLREAVLACEGSRRQAQAVDAVVERVRHLVGKRPRLLRHQPERNPKGVPRDWFWASELVLVEHGVTVNEKTVARLAVDAWRVSTLLRDKGKTAA